MTRYTTFLLVRACTILMIGCGHETESSETTHITKNGAESNRTSSTANKAPQETVYLDALKKEDVSPEARNSFSKRYRNKFGTSLTNDPHAVFALASAFEAGNAHKQEASGIMTSIAAAVEAQVGSDAAFAALKQSMELVKLPAGSRTQSSFTAPWGPSIRCSVQPGPPGLPPEIDCEIVPPPPIEVPEIPCHPANEPPPKDSNIPVCMPILLPDPPDEDIKDICELPMISCTEDSVGILATDKIEADIGQGAAHVESFHADMDNTDLYIQEIIDARERCEQGDQMCHGYFSNELEQAYRMLEDHVTKRDKALDDLNGFLDNLEQGEAQCHATASQSNGVSITCTNQ